MMLSKMLTTMMMMMMMMMTANVGAFTIRPSSSSPSTTIRMINKNIENMIDQEYYRQHHKEEYYTEWMQQNKNNVVVVPEKDNDISSYMLSNDNDSNDYMYKKQLMRDEYLARTNPQQYCMDRCVATGYCDVYEDIFDFTPEEVMSFCKDCVLSEDKEGCNVPEAFYEQLTENPHDDMSRP